MPVVILGILILLVFAVIVVATIARGDDPTQIDLGWFVIRSNVTGVFLAGALTLLLGVVGLLVLLSGLRRSRRRRSEVKELRDRATATADSKGHREATDADESFDSAPREPQ